MNERNEIQLPKAFTDKFNEMKLDKAKKLHNKYLDTCRRFLHKVLPHVESDKVNFPLKTAQDLCGDFIYKGTRYYTWHEFYNIQPFFYVITLGNNITNMVSEVKIYDQKQIDLLIDTANTELLVKTYYSKYDTNEKIYIPIDYKSLCNYINRTQTYLNNLPHTDNRYVKVLRNLRTVKFFKIITEHFYKDFQEYVIPHVKKPEIYYGRTFYKGINLQNCSKEVRTAVLGDHVSYDLNAAAYAIRLILVENICNEYGYDFVGQFTYTKEYLDHKSQIRDMLANVIRKHMPNYPDPLKLVKEAINAIGFGAKMHEGSYMVDGIRQYTALHDIIYNKEARIAFIKHDFMVNFLKEQDIICKIIYEYYNNNIDFKNKVKDIPNMYVNGRLKKSNVLAYLYQHMETMIMDTILSDIVPKFRLHDSFIMNKPLDIEEYKQLKLMLIELSPYLTLSCEEYNGWIGQDIYDIEQEHKKFIEQEELKANHGILPIKFTKKQDKLFVQHDGMYYDGYDNGIQYDQYDIERDEMLEDMTLQERENHFRIVGYDRNKLPDHIQKLIKK